MQHVVGCPTWEHSHPNRCWVSKWGHGYLNRCSVSKMGTWFSKSMFDLSRNETLCSKSMLDFPHGNMICQVDVRFPKWEHGCPNRCWMSIHTLGSNNGFKQWVQTMGSNMMRCTSLEWYWFVEWCIPSAPTPPHAFPPVHPFLSSRVPPTASWQQHCWPST